MTESNTIVFGLDGACFELIQPWLDEGRLPTLQRLIQDGGQSELDSCVPATTPPAWTSLTTGVNPGKHGIFGFYSREQGTYDIEPVSDSNVHARRLWDYTSMADLTSLVVNVPVTHPSREIDGAVVPGYLARNQPETYPTDVLSQVGMEDYRVYAPSEADDVASSKLLSEWLDLTESRRDLALALMDEYDWDMLFLEFQKTDGAVHKFDDRTKVREIFERVDACMADVIDATDGDPNVFVVSDHGIGQEKDWSVALNTWFEQEGYLETTTGDATDKSWIEQATTTGEDAEDQDQQTGGRDGESSLLRSLGRLGLTKQRIERVLTSLGLYDTVTRIAPEGLGNSLSGEVVDREYSTAFYEGMGFSGVDVGVVLNDERFYPSGTVSADEYEQVRDEVMAALRELEGPKGRAFSRVRPREEVYEGELVTQAPDIVLEQSPRYVIGSQYPRGKPFIPADEGRIDHKRTGLLVASGPDIPDGWSLEETPSIMDVTPTLLHLFGLPLNERFDGDVMRDVIATDSEPRTREFDSYEPDSRSGFTSSEEEELRERLQGMGYLE